MFANLTLPVFGCLGEFMEAGCDKRDKAMTAMLDDGVGCLHRAFVRVAALSLGREPALGRA